MSRTRGWVVTAGLLLLCFVALGTPALADPPPGDTCDSAIVLDTGTWEFLGDLSTYANDYDPGIPGPSCTGSGAPGKDMAFRVRVDCMWWLAISLTPVGFDGSIYIVRDCSDVTGTCVDGSDSQGIGGVERVSCHAAVDEDPTFYVIVDAHDAEAGGSFRLNLDWSITTEPLGACCYSDGTCRVGTFNSCILGEGDFHMCIGCDPDPCPPTPAKERSWGGIKARYR